MANRCLNHPERDAVGICVKCRKFICIECTTRIEGVNYCADCLPRAQRREGKHTRSWEKPAAVFLTLTSLLVCSLCVSAFLVFGIPQARSDVAQERWEENDELMEGVVQALLEFREDCGRFPSDEEGLEALLYDYGYYGWRGPYLEDPQFNEWDEIVDIYGTALEYRYKGLQSPVLVSAGGDGEFEGDIGRLIFDEGERGDDVVFWVR